MTDQADSLKDMGMEFSLDQCELRYVIFYHINCISPYLYEGQEYCSIHTNGTEYICRYSVKCVEALLNLAHKGAVTLDDFN